LSLVMGLLGPILFAGTIYAAREVDSARPARPGHLLQGLREGKAVALMAMLLVVMIGSQQLQAIVQVMEQMQTNPDPELAESLPAGRMLAWLAVAMVGGVVVGFFPFVAVP